ncbi:MAG: hypothetical protein ACTSVZ_06620 [Promethearchaeota archaeon]
MEPLEILALIKTIMAGITFVVGLIAAIVEIRKNPSYWLNRFFGLFFTFASLGFLGYVAYHIILTNIGLTLNLMIATNLILNASIACLLMTEFILEYSERIAMTPKYIISTLVLYGLSIFAYFIPFGRPEVVAKDYIAGSVNTHTPVPWLIIVTLYRLTVAFYVQFKLMGLMKKTEGKVKRQLKLFNIGVFFIILGILLFLLGNIPGTIGIILEITGQICLNIGMIEITRGFLVKES